MALLDACTGGSQGTGFSNTNSPSASIDGINFVDPSTGTVSNVFIAGGIAIATPTPTPTPTPAGQTPAPTATPSPSAPPTITPAPTATPKPTPTPPFTVVVTPTPSPGPGANPNQPVLIQAVGYKKGGGVLGYVSVPSTTFRWHAAYAPSGTTVTNRNDGTTLVCGAPPAAPAIGGSGAPINIDYQFAPTTSTSVPNNGDTLDAKHPGFAIAATDSTQTTTNYYNNIAFFAPQIKAGKYCVTLLATSQNGVQGSVIVVVNL
jgi:hypothetical protein